MKNIRNSLFLVFSISTADAADYCTSVFISGSDSAPEVCHDMCFWHCGWNGNWTCGVGACLSECVCGCKCGE